MRRTQQLTPEEEQKIRQDLDKLTPEQLHEKFEKSLHLASQSRLGWGVDFLGTLEQMDEQEK